MTREEAIRHLEEWKECISSAYRRQVIDMAIEALSSDAVKVAYICDGRKCNEDCSYCFRTLDIKHAKDFKLVGDVYYQQESADQNQRVKKQKKP